jgi:hypothetical protein
MENKPSFIRKWFPYLAAGYFILLTIFMTWPLVTVMGNQMVGQVGDNIYFVWMIGWFKKALFDLHVNPFNVWFLNYPEGWSLAYTEITPAQLLLALPSSLFAGPAFAYNVAHMLSFALSGLIMALWVRRLTDSHGAALLAGTAYAFLPFHFAHFLIGHLNLSGLQWFPLFFWGFFDLLLCHTDRNTPRHADRREASLTDGEDTSDARVLPQTVRDPSLALRMTKDPRHADRREASRSETVRTSAGQDTPQTVRDPSLALTPSRRPSGRMTGDSRHADRREASRTGGEDTLDARVLPQTVQDPSLSLTPSRRPSGRMTGDSRHADRREASRTGEEGTSDGQDTPPTVQDPSLSLRMTGTSRKSAILRTGMGLGLIALTSQYYLFMTGIIAAFIFAVYVLFINRPILKQHSFWMGWLIAALVSLPLIAVAVAPYVSLAGKGELPDRELGIVRPYSAGLTDFVLPSTDHFLWGKWVGEHFNRDMWVEGTLYVGLVNAGLAIYAWVNRKKNNRKTLLILMLAGGALALLLAMGTDLHWNGAPVEIPTPAFLQARWDKPTIPLPLPGWVLFKFFPFYAKLRALMRFGIFVLLFVCTAAGLGAAEILKRVSPGWKNATAAGLILLVLFDFYPGPYTEFTTVQARPVDTWLSQQPGDGAVVQMPFSIAEDQEHTYYTLVHGKPYVGGFFNAFPPAQYKRIKPILLNFPDKASVELLRELKVRWVLVDKNKYCDWNKTQGMIERFGFNLEAEPGGMAVFTIQLEK